MQSKLSPLKFWQARLIFVEHIRWSTVRILKPFRVSCKVPPTGLTGLSSPDTSHAYVAFFHFTSS